MPPLPKISDPFPETHFFLFGLILKGANSSKTLGQRISKCQPIFSLTDQTLHRFVLIFFHTLVLQEYCHLTESRIPLKPVLGGVRTVALSISSYAQTQ